MKESHILITGTESDYELLDSGENEKLERFGPYILSRPDPQALWKKNDPSLWKTAHGSFTREEKRRSADDQRVGSTESRAGGGSDWSLVKDIPARWEISFGDLKFVIKPTAFKHVGIFPEQSVNWRWVSSIILKASAAATSSVFPTILNLFGYTGGATLACAQAGASVVHVDGSKSAIAWARENTEISGLVKKPIRWILDDARAFVKREIKRGSRYDGIVMDPPAFGHGPNNELWKIEDHFLPLIDECMKLLSEKPLFFLINGYSAGYSAVAYENNLLPLVEKYGGSVEIGELAIRETEGAKGEGRSANRADGGREVTGRLLPCGIFARWSAM